MPRPTNDDLLVEIRQNHTEVVTRLSAVEDQVKHTNGRVKKLELSEGKRAAVEEYKQKNPSVTINTKKVEWFEAPEVKRLFLALAAVASALAAYLAYLAGTR